MKSCPTCNRTYPDDSLAFCLIDGSVLSAPYDPEATQRISPPRNTSPAATEALKATAAPDQSRPAMMSTIRAPAPQLPPQYAPPHPSYSAEKEKRAAAMAHRDYRIARWCFRSGAVGPQIAERETCDHSIFPIQGCDRAHQTNCHRLRPLAGKSFV